MPDTDIGLRACPSGGAHGWQHTSTFFTSCKTTIAAFQSWTLAAVDRPLSLGEANPAGQPKGPVEHSIAVLWGDTASNYLGTKDIYDLRIVDAAGNEFVAGNVPEPASLALLGVAFLGLAATRRRQRRG